MKILCPLTYFTFEESIEFVVGKNILYAEEPIFSPAEVKAFGTVDIERIITLPGLRISADNKDPESVVSADVSKLAQISASRVELFLFALWFVKDNSVNAPLTLVCIEETKELRKEPSLLANSNAKGQFESTNFSKGELALASSFHDEIIKVTENSMSLMSITNETSYNKHNLITRAFQFIWFARQNYFLPAKVSNYISAMECLFSTEAMDLNHRISELVTLYVGGEPETKYSNYKTISEAYDVTTSYIHGSSLKVRRENASAKAKSKDASPEILEAISYSLDSLTRSLFVKVLQNQEFFIDNKSLQDDLKKLTFA